MKFQVTRSPSRADDRPSFRDVAKASILSDDRGLFLLWSTGGPERSSAWIIRVPLHDYEGLLRTMAEAHPAEFNRAVSAVQGDAPRLRIASTP